VAFSAVAFGVFQYHWSAALLGADGGRCHGRCGTVVAMRWLFVPPRMRVACENRWRRSAISDAVARRHGLLTVAFCSAIVGGTRYAGMGVIACYRRASAQHADRTWKLASCGYSIAQPGRIQVGIWGMDSRKVRSATQATMDFDCRSPSKQTYDTLLEQRSMSLTNISVLSLSPISSDPRSSRKSLGRCWGYMISPKVHRLLC
jgi:hypothetical protein